MYFKPLLYGNPSLKNITKASTIGQFSISVLNIISSEKMTILNSSYGFKLSRIFFIGVLFTFLAIAHIPNFIIFIFSREGHEVTLFIKD